MYLWYYWKLFLSPYYFLFSIIFYYFLSFDIFCFFYSINIYIISSQVRSFLSILALPLIKIRTFMDQFEPLICFSAKCSCLPMHTSRYLPSLSFSCSGTEFPIFLPRSCMWSLHAGEIHSCNSNPNQLCKSCSLFHCCPFAQKAFSQFFQ